MDININALFKTPENGDFNYSNIKSEYGCNTRCFTKNGKPHTFVAGEIHFSRVPSYRWKETLLKMRECGLNTISTYVFWNYHEEIKGEFDFSGDRDVAKFLSVCREIEMPCILRIGPWCHGEVIRGGFPKRINRMPKKRTDNEKYLDEVREFWQGLYKEVEPFLDGKTVIGLQLENEYTGPTSHLKTLRKIAEEIGFKVPFFTMTAWPSGVPDRDFLPMTGGYPDAPWSRGKKALSPNNRFAVTPAKTEDEIGADLHKNKKSKIGVYDNVPYASCETGPGNQVTQHRRPFISEKDGYGVGFAKFASGLTFLGYYMFCGGRNPAERLMQENCLTGYPNNYPVIDYDFQAPISRYGVCRPHGDRLRLMHMFIKEFDPEICAKQAFFPKWISASPTDISFLKCSVRVDENMSGYFFFGAYEKGLKYNDFKNVNITVSNDKKTIALPSIGIKAGTMSFFPFNIKLCGKTFDYILAQPLIRTEENGETACYFVECEGIAPKCRVNGVEYDLALFPAVNTVDGVKITVIPYEKAKSFHYINKKAFFTDGTVYSAGERIFCERETDVDIKNEITLEKCRPVHLPRNYFLYSHGKRAYYKLKLSKDILKNRFDVKLVFDFNGLNLQLFSGETLIDDCFNIDKSYVIHLRDYREIIEKDGDLTIRTAPKTRFGISNVYSEIPLPLYSNNLELRSACVIEKKEIL